MSPPFTSGLFEVNEQHHGQLHPNPINMALGMHFGPEKSREIGQVEKQK